MQQNGEFIMTAARPRRQRKSDRLLNPGSTAREIEVDHAIAPFDRAATDMDRKWGIDQLPGLVSPELAARYGAAVAHLNACIEDSDPAACIAAVGNCIRGMQAMDAEATRLGHQPASPDYWEAEIDGFRFAVMREGRDWQVHHEARPDLRFFSLREVGVALKALRIDNPLFAEVQKQFPQSEIISIAKRSKPQTHEDPIPF